MAIINPHVYNRYVYCKYVEIYSFAKKNYEDVYEERREFVFHFFYLQRFHSDNI